MAKYNAYDPELQQKVGKRTLLTILAALGLFGLVKCASITPSEKFMKCYVNEMRGQGEHMRSAVIVRCEQKTGFDWDNDELKPSS